MMPNELLYRALTSRSLRLGRFYKVFIICHEIENPSKIRKPTPSSVNSHQMESLHSAANTQVLFLLQNEGKHVKSPIIDQDK